jgi:hypothetical protein
MLLSWVTKLLVTQESNILEPYSDSMMADKLSLAVEQALDFATQIRRRRTRSSQRKALRKEGFQVADQGRREVQHHGDGQARRDRPPGDSISGSQARLTAAAAPILAVGFARGQEPLGAGIDVGGSMPPSRAAGCPLRPRVSNSAGWGFVAAFRRPCRW